MCEPVLVSACIFGLNTRWDGSNRKNEELLRQLEGKCLVPVCPEQLGGLSTPRPPAAFRRGTGEQVLRGKAFLLNKAGQDVTDQYIRGAEETLLVAQQLGVREAYFKARSPSCGKGRVYLDGALCNGSGVCTALLEKHGIIVHSID